MTVSITKVEIVRPGSVPRFEVTLTTPKGTLSFETESEARVDRFIKDIGELVGGLTEPVTIKTRRHI